MKRLFFIVGLLAVFSCDDIIEVPDISDEVVSILAPTDGATLTNTSVTFNWNAVEDAENYRLQIATPTFDAAQQIEIDRLIDVASLAEGLSFTTTLQSGGYEWRIRAENSAYQTAYTTQSFEVLAPIVDISNEQVVLLAPANSTVFNTTSTINFSWEAVLNAEQYTIQIATPDFDNPLEIVDNQTLSDTNVSVSNLGAQDYEWRVRAENAEYQTTFTTRSFTVEE